MKPTVVISRNESAYARTVVEGLCLAGAPPARVLLGARSEQLLFKLRSFQRVWRQLGLVEAGLRLHRSRAAAPLTVAGTSIQALSRSHGFTVKNYDFINSGSLILDILELPAAVVVLAGCGLVDRAVLHAARGGCVNGHPALLPGIRGVDVVEHALLEGHPIGVSAHLVTAQVDAGPVLCTEHVPLLAGESWDAFNARIVERQAAMLVEAALDLANDRATTRPNPKNQSVLRFAASHKMHRAARRIFQTQSGGAA